MEALAVVGTEPYLTYFTFTEEPVADVAATLAAVGAMVVPGVMVVAEVVEAADKPALEAQVAAAGMA
jgi:uncharacterized MnhB-related membrane protein